MEFAGRDAHQNSPSHHSEAVPMSGFTENAPWHAQNAAPAQHNDPRLRPDAGPLYGKSATQYGQPMMNTRPPSAEVTPMTWTAGSETSAAPSGTAPQPAVTPGLVITVYLLGHTAFSALMLLVGRQEEHPDPVKN